MSRHLLLAIVASCVVAGCDRRSDEQRLQGEWELREMHGWFTFDLTPFRKDDEEVLTVDRNRSRDRISA